MLDALKSSWPTFVTGLALSALITGSAQLAETQSIDTRAKYRADVTVKRALVRFEQEGNHAENALDFIRASHDATAALPDFLKRLDSSYQKPLSGSTWLWVRSYGAGETAAAAHDLETVLSKPATLTGDNGKPLTTVFYAHSHAGALTPGYNLATEPWVDRALNGADQGPLFTVIGPGESAIWPKGAFVIEVSDAGSPDRVLRIVTQEDLETIAFLSDDQTVSISDQQHPGFVLGDPAPEGSSGAVTDSIPSSPQTMVSVPVLPTEPVVWIPVLVVSLMMTGLATVLHAGQILRDRATQTLALLSGTQSALADSQISERAFFENAGTANCVIDAKTLGFNRVNDQMCAALGYNRDELLKLSVKDVTHPDDMPQAEAAMHALITGGSSMAQYEKRIVNKAGESLWCLVNARSFRTGLDQRLQFATTVIDISARKEAEMRRDDLVRELAHRVRNTVQLTASLARQTAKSARTVEEYDTRFQERLAALKAAQDSLFEVSWASVPLTDVAERTLAPFIATHGERLKISLPNLRLNAQQAQTMAIALHELAANSSIHGALGHEGTAELHGFLQRGEGVALVLEWDDHHPGASVTKPKRRGFGTQVLKTLLPGQFGGEATLEWRKGGFYYHVSLPVSHQPADLGKEPIAG